jgi:hypothetical protein
MTQKKYETVEQILAKLPTTLTPERRAQFIKEVKALKGQDYSGLDNLSCKYGISPSWASALARALCKKSPRKMRTEAVKERITQNHMVRDEVRSMFKLEVANMKINEFTKKARRSIKTFMKNRGGILKRSAIATINRREELLGSKEFNISHALNTITRLKKIRAKMSDKSIQTIMAVKKASR